MSIEYEHFETQCKKFAEDSKCFNQISLLSCMPVRLTASCIRNAEAIINYICFWNSEIFDLHLKVWEWVGASTGDPRSFIEGGVFLSLNGWLHETSSDNSSVREDKLDHCDLSFDNSCNDLEIYHIIENEPDFGCLPHINEDLLPHVYDYHVVSSSEI